jgi:hypothetical protein
VFKLPTGDQTVDLDLTEPIQSFTDRVYMQAQKSGLIEPSLDAKYVRRVHLKDYLPPSILKIDKSLSAKVCIFQILFRIRIIFLCLTNRLFRPQSKQQIR